MPVTSAARSATRAEDGDEPRLGSPARSASRASPGSRAKARCGSSVRDGAVTDVALEIFEPPRFFEALLVGRHFTEAPDITARICGICPVAYQMSACAAMEDACGVTVDERVVGLAPAALLRRVDPEPRPARLPASRARLPRLRRRGRAGRAGPRRGRSAACSIKRTGNLVMETVGGRAVHPVNVRVGGFYRAPDPDAVAALAEPLRRARDAALATVEWVSGFDFPDVAGDYRFVALRDAGPLPDRARPAGLARTDWTPARPSSPTWWSRSTSPGPPPSTLGWTGATPT